MSVDPPPPPLNTRRPAFRTCRNSPDQPLFQDLSYDRIPRYGTPDEHDSVLGEVDGSISYTLCEVQDRGERGGEGAEDGHLRKRLYRVWVWFVVCSARLSSGVFGLAGRNAGIR
jgi:hypothetical protein